MIFIILETLSSFSIALGILYEILLDMSLT
jgi:hypothetical protein